MVAIIGVVAAIAVPRMSSARERSESAALAASIRTIGEAIYMYRQEHGEYPPDGSTGKMPSELRAHVRGDDWPGIPPGGGEWDNETNDSGVTAAFGVVYESSATPNLELLQAVDAILDDGDLDQGIFRMIASGRYSLVVEE